MSIWSFVQYSVNLKYLYVAIINILLFQCGDQLFRHQNLTFKVGPRAEIVHHTTDIYFLIKRTIVLRMRTRMVHFIVQLTMPWCRTNDAPDTMHFNQTSAVYYCMLYGSKHKTSTFLIKITIISWQQSCYKQIAPFVDDANANVSFFYYIYYNSK